MPAFIEPKPGLVRDRPPTVATCRNVVATPFRQDGLRISGGLYEGSGKLIRRVQWTGPRLTPCDPEFLLPSEPIETVGGRGYYIGYMMGQYGHFITETISSSWAVDRTEVDYYAAHSFKWGPGIPEFGRDALRRIGVPPERVRIIERETRFENLIVPDRLWHCSRSVNRRFDAVLGRITAGHLRSRPGLRLYLSRSEIPRRSIGNERDVEDLFRRAGFEVLHPQNHGLPTQLELYGRAAVLAGLAGSALHNIIFCPKGAATISIGDSRAGKGVTRNQLVCGALAGGLTAAIPFAGDRQGLHIPTLARELAAVLERLGDDPAPPESP